MRIVADTKMGFARKCFGLLGDVTWLPTPELTKETIRGADAIIIRSETRIGRQLLDGTNVRFVGTATIGTDHVDLGYLKEAGIGFAAAPGSNANSVGEYVVAGLLEHARIHRLQLNGMTIGIVGVGNVGSRVARYAGALGMRTLLNDPPLARSTGEERYLPLDDLMGADVITLHVPLTREGADPTHQLFDAARIGRMKKGVLFINTSRGGVVETGALSSALREGRSGAALLDVWEGEPAISPELLRLAEIGTPHIAGFSTDGKLNAARMLFDAIARHFSLHAEWETPPDIPGPATPEIRLHSKGLATEELVRTAVAQSYSIVRDDHALRQMLKLPPTERASFFSSLRANYPHRREFHTISVRITPPQPEAASTLAALGFRIQ